MGLFTQDLRSALRSLAWRKGPATVVILTLALGIGLTSAVFSVVHAVLLRALPFAEPERLVEVAGLRVQGAEAEEWVISLPDFEDWRAGTRSFAGLAVHSGSRSFNLLVDGEPEHLTGEMVSAGYFKLLGVVPAAGRSFSAEEDDPADPRSVAILGYDLWQRRFGGEGAVIGRTLVLDGLAHTVVGVAPAGFRGVTDEADIWLPVAMAGKTLGSHYTEKRRFRWLSALGRLRPGATVAQAQQELDTLGKALEGQFPETNEGIRARVTPLQDAWVGDLRGRLLILLGTAVFVLLIACTNVAALLVSQAVERQREISIRAALGAGRLRLIRQFLTESLALAGIGCLLGVLLGQWSVRLLSVASAIGLRSFVQIGLDPAVLGFALGIALLCGLIVGLVPAWIASRADLGATLKEGGKHSASGGLRRFQSALVVTEIAFSLALLVAAGLAIRGFRDLLRTDLGFQPGQVLTLRLDIKDRRYRDDEAVFALVRQAIERSRAVPGVVSVALAGPTLPTDSGDGAHFTVEDRHDPAEDGNLLFWTNAVSPGYFSTLGIPLREGRDFTFQDTKGTLWAAIVSESAAKRYWPGQSPLGRRVTLGPRDTRFPWFTVIGVAADVRNAGLGPAAATQEPVDIYFALLQFPPRMPPLLGLVVRTAPGIDPAGAAGALRAELKAVDPALPAFDVATLDERLTGQTARPRLVARLMGLFAALALTLAAVGIYGALSYAATRRSREMGIRLALGAGRGNVLWLLVRQSAVLALAGIVIGLGLALALTRVLARFLEEIGSADPWIFSGTAALLLAVALLAGLLPARRAARVDPTTTLRAD
jgi:predicted permease